MSLVILRMTHIHCVRKFPVIPRNHSYVFPFVYIQKTVLLYRII